MKSIKEGDTFYSPAEIKFDPDHYRKLFVLFPIVNRGSARLYL